MKLEDIERESEIDLAMSLDSIDHESIKTPSIHHKYLKELIFAKDLYDDYDLQMRALKFKKWLYYSGKAEPKVYDEKPLDLKVMKSDVNKFVEADSDVLDLEYKVSFVKRKILFIEKILDECNRRSFHLSTAQRALSFKHGENR